MSFLKRHDLLRIKRNMHTTSKKRGVNVNAQNADVLADIDSARLELIKME